MLVDGGLRVVHATDVYLGLRVSCALRCFLGRVSRSRCPLCRHANMRAMPVATCVTVTRRKEDARSDLVRTLTDSHSRRLGWQAAGGRRVPPLSTIVRYYVLASRLGVCVYCTDYIQ